MTPNGTSEEGPGLWGPEMYNGTDTSSSLHKSSTKREILRDYMAEGHIPSERLVIQEADDVSAWLQCTRLSTVSDPTPPLKMEDAILQAWPLGENHGSIHEWVVLAVVPASAVLFSHHGLILPDCRRVSAASLSLSW